MVFGDLKALPLSLKKTILQVVESKLAVRPDAYGKPLGGKLAGLRRIRIGEHRLVYEVRSKAVVIWAVKHRSEVYLEAERRFKDLP